MKHLEVHRQSGRYPLHEVKAVIKRHGIVILKQLLSRETQLPLRALLESKVAGAKRAATLHQTDYPKADFLLGDVLAVRELEPVGCIFFSPESIEAIKAALDTDELSYWGDSSIQFGEAARGFHKDNVDRSDGTKDDWNRDYDLVRCGFYFEDHNAHHSGGLKVRLGSHEIANHRDGPIADVSTQYGDLVIWNMRLTHSGNNKRLRFPAGVALHPRVEEKIPSFLAAPEQMRRIAAFCSFGKAGSHLDRYIDKMNANEKDYKPYFQFARKPAEAAPLLAGWNVRFRQPNSYYGEFD